MAKLEDEVAAAVAALEAERKAELDDYSAVHEMNRMDEVAARLSEASRAQWLALPEQRQKRERGEAAKGRQKAKSDAAMAAEIARQGAGRQAAE